MPPNAGIPVDKLKDKACVVKFQRSQQVLMNKDIPFQEKKEMLERFFKKLNFLKRGSRIVLLFCMVNLLFLLYYNNFASFYLLIEKLRKMFQSGKISRVLYYAILQKLKKRVSVWTLSLRI